MELEWLAPDAAGIPASTAMQQHPRHAEAMARFGRRARLARLEAGGEAALVLDRRVAGLSLALTTRPAAPTRDWLEAVYAALPFGALAVNAAAPGDAAALRAAGFAMVRERAWIAELDLTAPEEARRARMGQKWRNRLAAAERAGLTIRRRALPPDPAHPALAEEAAQRRARGYAGLPPAFAAAWASAAPGAAALFEAMDRGAPVARMLFLLHPPGATYFLGWVGPEGRRMSAHQAVLWRACGWLERQGVEALDLGVVETETAPGLARFKLGAGAQARELGGTWLRGPGSRLFAGGGGAGSR